jgi:hypothetical protein
MFLARKCHVELLRHLLDLIVGMFQLMFSCCDIF